MDKELESLANELVRLGTRVIKSGEKENDAHRLRVGNLLRLLGNIITDEKETADVDDFLLYFSAKKIMESVNPIHLVLARQIGEIPDLKDLIDTIIGGIDGDICDNCVAKDTCEDKHCMKTKNVDEKPAPKKRRTPRTPKKPKE